MMAYTQHMTNALPFRHVTQRPGRIRLWLTLLTYLLIGIRFVAAVGAYICVADWEIKTIRTVHIHAAGSHSHCQHAKSTVNPFVGWACTVYQDDQMLLLPDKPHMPMRGSVLATPVLQGISFTDSPLIDAHGR
ncbi:MAG: hypothetical protein KC588_13870, partial [Nitrospira sp.]|nr:hypothetical protein [Nitrospira sp.]